MDSDRDQVELDVFSDGLDSSSCTGSVVQSSDSQEDNVVGVGGLCLKMGHDLNLVRNTFQSPECCRTYEIKAKNLWYKIEQSKSVPWKFWKRKKGCHPFTEATTHYVLKDINCEAHSGEILAIAGPSGAGKSTLLELLAGRIRPSSPPSSILVNQEPMDRSRFRRISGYVTQDDALFPLLTVVETLQFSARLRLPATMPTEEKAARVKALISELGLEHVADSRIGNEEIRGVSGGERRRVSIGVDVIHDPAILLLDEPTSGLDSAAALQVTCMLRTMAEIHSRTVILSIHQPGYRILQLINSILLLADGSVVHHGSLDELQCRLEGLGHQIPAQVNVLEYAIDAIDSLEAEKGRLFRAGEGNADLSLQKFFLLNGQQEADPEASEANFQEVVIIPEADYNRPSFANSAVEEILVLAHRFSKNIFRTKQLFAARTLQAIVTGFCLGTIFLNVGNDLEGVQERIGFFAFTLTFLLSSTTEGLPIFLQERHILMRETSRGAYRVSSYVAANTLVFLPFLLIVAALYAIPVYWLVGLSGSWHAFLFFFLVVYLIVLMANSFVACFSALAPNFIMGNSLIAGLMGAFFLFSGYFISKDNIPKYWTFLHYLSLFKYPFEALLINEFSSLDDTCLSSIGNEICTLTGKDVLRGQGLSHTDKWVNVGVMVSFVCTYRLLCFFVLRTKVYKSRR